MATIFLTIWSTPRVSMPKRQKLLTMTIIIIIWPKVLNYVHGQNFDHDHSQIFHTQMANGKYKLLPRNLTI